VRGKPISSATRKADIVLVAARYSPADGRVVLAQGFERRGPIWSDRVLFDRQTLVEAVRRGKRVYAARRTVDAHDFELLAPLQLEGINGDMLLRAGETGAASRSDSLAVPLF
jgi:hypothetical protein